jgi:hypothetical protein
MEHDQIRSDSVHNNTFKANHNSMSCSFKGKRKVCRKYGNQYYVFILTIHNHIELTMYLNF